MSSEGPIPTPSCDRSPDPQLRAGVAGRGPPLPTAAQKTAQALTGAGRPFNQPHSPLDLADMPAAGAPMTPTAGGQVPAGLRGGPQPSALSVGKIPSARGRFCGLWGPNGQSSRHSFCPPTPCPRGLPRGLECQLQELRGCHSWVYHEPTQLLSSLSLHFFLII